MQSLRYHSTERTLRTVLAKDRKQLCDTRNNLNARITQQNSPSSSPAIFRGRFVVYASSPLTYILYVVKNGQPPDRHKTLT